MKTTFVYYFFFSIFFLISNSCSSTNDKETKAMNYIEEQIESESNGVLKLKSFAKTNGLERDFAGFKAYILEWQGEIIGQETFWKDGSMFEGYFKNFKVHKKNPGEGIGLSSPKHFNAGVIFSVEGKCILTDTDNGWRVEKIEIGKVTIKDEGKSTDSPKTEAKETLAKIESGTREDNFQDDNHPLLGEYKCKLDNKDLTLTFEKIQGQSILGWSQVGNNKRPLNGIFSSKNRSDGTDYHLVLKEPGGHKWDGEFVVIITITDQGWGGKGTWKSYDGKLNRTVLVLYE